eukprot:CAMPEP_0118953888 /NCGR_PEP_ID=MMETSP1169-20130426/57324_1 /TAXON_ID=36882 /ORGANISM="Pyramimonas obovata, Strain CCMP722" /LENGTH=90 /DNA_ID=CAMNT_0006901435 /DNA_START=656 /DNA_END=928 /DNA_ORIENTATION=-
MREKSVCDVSVALTNMLKSPKDTDVTLPLYRGIGVHRRSQYNKTFYEQLRACRRGETRLRNQLLSNLFVKAVQPALLFDKHKQLKTLTQK